MTTRRLVERTITDFKDLYDPALIGRTVSITFTDGFDERGRFLSESSIGVVEGVTRDDEKSGLYYLKLSGRNVIHFDFSKPDDAFAPSFTLAVYRPESGVEVC